MPVSPSATALIRRRQRTTSSSASRPSLLAIEHPLAAVAVAGRHLHDRRTRGAGGVVDAAQQLDLVGLGDLVGVALDGVDRRRDGRGVRATVRVPPPPWRAAAAAASAAASRPALAEVAGVGEAGRLAGDDADAGAAVAAARHLLDAPVVERRRRRAFVLGVDLGELAARSHRRGEHPFQDVVVDHPVEATGGALGGSGRGRRERPASATWTVGRTTGVPTPWALAWPPVTVATGLRGEAKMVVGEARTRRAPWVGHGRRARHAAADRPVRGGLLPGHRRRRSPTGTTTVGMKVRLDHLQPSPVGATVIAEAMLSQGRGPPPDVHRLGLRRPRPRRRRQGGARRRRRRALPGQVRRQRVALISPDVSARTDVETGGSR